MRSTWLLVSAAWPVPVKYSSVRRPFAGPRDASCLMTSGAKRKGKAEPVRVFKVTSAKADITGLDRQVSSEMVGRDRELDRLELQVMKAVNGEGSVVNVIGEAGIGKSRLMAELQRREVMKR